MAWYFMYVHLEISFYVLLLICLVVFLNVNFSMLFIYIITSYIITTSAYP